jgi:hypothetical protein
MCPWPIDHASSSTSSYDGGTDKCVTKLYSAQGDKIPTELIHEWPFKFSFPFTNSLRATRTQIDTYRLNSQRNGKFWNSILYTVYLNQSIHCTAKFITLPQKCSRISLYNIFLECISCFSTGAQHQYLHVAVLIFTPDFTHQDNPLIRSESQPRELYVQMRRTFSSPKHS